MRVLLIGLLAVSLFYVLFLLACLAIVLLLPKSFLSKPAMAALKWLPPLLRGDALREWAASTAERLARERLAGERTSETATKLAADIEAGAMRAMLPRAVGTEIDRVIACPEVGQGLVGVTAPEVLAIAEHIRKNLPRAEQERIHSIAAANAKRLTAQTPAGGCSAVLECPLQGHDHVCCVYAERPLRCRILHAATIANDAGQQTPPETPGGPRHEETVAEGIELGVTRALATAGLSAKVYELNSALVTALDTPDAAVRWAAGEDVFASASVSR